MQVQKTYMGKPQNTQRKWHVVDVAGRVLGDVSTEIAQLLVGKNKPTFTPHVDSGDYVVVINASKVEVTGNKAQDKMYYRHSGRPGGLKEENFTDLRNRAPAKVIEAAVKGMLPKNKMQTPRLRRMKVFAGNTHNYQDKIAAQQK